MLEWNWYLEYFISTVDTDGRVLKHQGIRSRSAKFAPMHLQELWGLSKGLMEIFCICFVFTYCPMIILPCAIKISMTFPVEYYVHTCSGHILVRILPMPSQPFHWLFLYMYMIKFTHPLWGTDEFKWSWSTAQFVWIQRDNNHSRCGYNTVQYILLPYTSLQR